MSHKKTPSAPKVSQADRAAALGVSTRTLREWEKGGMPDAEMRQRADRQRERASGSGDMGAARLRKLRAEASLRELELAKLRGELVAVADVEEIFAQISAAVRSALIRLIADLPPALEGLGPAKSQAIIRDYVYKTMTELHDAEFTNDSNL